jgi:hypothetical protein
MAVRARARTAEALWDPPDDGMRYELVRGELRVIVPPGAEPGPSRRDRGGPIVRPRARNRGRYHLRRGDGFLVARDPDTVRAADRAFVACSGPRQSAGPSRTTRARRVSSQSSSRLGIPSLRWRQMPSTGSPGGTKLVLVIHPARRTATSYRGPEDVQVHTGDTLRDLGDAVPG